MRMCFEARAATDSYSITWLFSRHSRSCFWDSKRMSPKRVFSSDLLQENSIIAWMREGLLSLARRTWTAGHTFIYSYMRTVSLHNIQTWKCNDVKTHSLSRKASRGQSACTPHRNTVAIMWLTLKSLQGFTKDTQILSRYNHCSSTDSNWIPPDYKPRFPPQRTGFKPGSGHVGFCDGQKWHWGRFSPRTSVSLADLHSICFSTIIFTITRGWHNRPGVAAVPIASQTRI
jgi:hypothetical protein